jgi:TP901 family phage tail tape measure protein
MADVGEIRARLVLSSDQFNRGMRDARGQMVATSQSANKVSKDIKAIHNAALALGGAMAVGLGAAVVTAANFEQKMADVKAVSGATGDEITKLGDLAKEMGMKTAFSATEAAGGIEELIKAGLTVEQIINGGLEASLNLAVAGNLQLAEAAEIASTALNSFKSDGLSAADAANILAGAANASATDVQEMKFGLSMVSAVASGIGLTFRDTATSLALFAQNGLKGSDAGTSLKTMLLNLSPSTEEASEQMGKLGLLTEKGTSAFYDANGSIRSMAEIAELLQTKLANLSDEQRQMALKTMFGTDAIRAANILYKEGAEGIDAMWTAMSKVTALDVATVKIDTLKGAFNEFTSSLESVGIEIGEEFLPGLTDLTRFVTDLVRRFGEVDASTIKVGLAMAGASTAVLLVGTSIAKLSVALRAFTLTPAGAAITALSILGGVIAGAVVQQNEMSKVTLENAEAMMDSHAALEGNIKQYDALKLKSRLTNDELARFVDINSEISKTADPNIIAALSDEQAKLQEKSGLSNEELNRMVELNGKIIEVVPESNTKLTEQGNVLLENTSAAKKYNAEQLEMIRLELEAQRAKAEASMEKNLVKETTLLGQMKTLKEDMLTLNEQETEQRRIIHGLEEELAIATANNDTSEMNRLNNSIAIEKQKHQIMKDQSAEQAELILKKAEEIDKVQAQIGKLDEVKRKMIDLELQQAGINAKRGEEVTTIEQALAKLEAQKRKLEETTPIAQRNSGEYQEAVTHIQNQIDNLNTVKSRILDITDAASVMNYQLGQTIRKDVIIRQVEGQSLKRMPGLDDKFHTGGIIGRGQLPKLHTGGLASQFADMPSHNEVDVRLLRNEMVLTEAQQANLMRMIDAGMSGKSESNGTDSETHRLLAEIKKEIRTGLNATVVMQEREVARIIEPYVSEEQARNKSRKERF